MTMSTSIFGSVASLLCALLVAMPSPRTWAQGGPPGIPETDTPGTTAFSPTSPTDCEPLTIAYLPGSALDDVDPVHAVIYYDDALEPVESAMTSDGSGGWLLSVDVPEGTSEALVYFQNAAANLFDINDGDFFVVSIGPCGSASTATGGLYGVRGDLEGDGRGDLILHFAPSNVYYVAYMNGASKVDGEFLLGTPTDVGSWRLAAVSDLDGDGQEDLIMGDGAGVYDVSYMDGALVRSSEFLLGLSDGIAPWRVVAGGDFNGDGLGDLVFRYGGEGLYYIGFMDGAQLAGGGFLLDGTDIAPWQVVGGADLDGDGMADLLVRSGSTHGVLFMQGATMRSADYLSAGGVTDWGPWTIAAASDLDGDGKSDLVAQNGSSGNYFVLFMEGAQAVAGDYLTGGPTNISPWQVSGPR